MKALYLIRHGRTPANDAHLYCGSTDLSLSETGRQELSSLHYEIHPDRIFTSGMARTEETLKILFGDLPHRVEPDFREIAFGDFECKSYEDLKDDPAYQAWITGDNFQNVPPNGESGAQMTCRVLKALEPILKAPESTLILSHGGVIAAIMASLFPEEEKNLYQWQPKPGRGYAVSDGHYRPIP